MDEIESVGLGCGNYAERFGGFVRPGGLAIDPNNELHGRRMEFMRARRGVRRGGQGRVEQVTLVGPDSAWRGLLAVQEERGIGDHYPVTPVFLRRVQGAVGRL